MLVWVHGLHRSSPCCRAHPPKVLCAGRNRLCPYFSEVEAKIGTSITPQFPLSNFLLGLQKWDHLACCLRAKMAGTFSSKNLHYVTTLINSQGTIWTIHFRSSFAPKSAFFLRSGVKMFACVWLYVRVQDDSWESAERTRRPGRSQKHHFVSDAALLQYQMEFEGKHKMLCKRTF